LEPPNVCPPLAVVILVVPEVVPEVDGL
jgi:hypothetical protein